MDNGQEFREQDASPTSFINPEPTPSFSRYEVNFFVDNNETKGAPIVYEPNPSYSNIIGKVEHHAKMGVLTTDLRLVRSGALHQASGGYLTIDAYRMLSKPFVWEALKQALAAREVRIESPGEAYIHAK